MTEVLDPIDVARRVVHVLAEVAIPYAVGGSIARPLGTEVSDRQWRDILGIVRVHGRRLDVALLHEHAPTLGVEDLLERASADRLRTVLRLTVA